MMPKRLAAVAVVLGSIGVLLCAGAAAAIAPGGSAAVRDTPTTTATATTYGGDAFAARVSTTLLATTIANTGPLPAKGGDREATPVMISNSVVKGRVLVAITMGANGETHSFAAVSGTTLLSSSSSSISALFVWAWANASCSGAHSGVEITDLSVAGHDIRVTGKPDQKVSVGGMTLELFKKHVVNHGNYHFSEATAVTLKLGLGLGEIQIGHAQAAVTCHTTTKSSVNLAVGAGYIAVAHGNATFGFEAGKKVGAHTDSVSLVYLGPPGGIKVKALSISTFVGTGDTRTFTGTCAINGKGGFTYNVTVVDGDDSGHVGGHDSFSIALSNGYHATGTLLGGDIDIET